MFENFIICIRAVIPMFILLLVGLAVRWGRLVTEAELRHFNHLIFVIGYPCMMFGNIYKADLVTAFNAKFIAFGVGAVLATVLISIPIIMKIEKRQESRGAMIQAIYRSNVVIMGLPLAINIYGHGNLAPAAVMIAFVVPIYNVVAVITLETFRKGKVHLASILLNVAKNPIILGGVAGLLFALMGWSLPDFVSTVVDDLSVTACTMALVILGASFAFESVLETKRNLLICTFARLMLVPGIFLPLAAILGFRDIYFVTLVAVLATPTAIGSYTMAQSMGSDAKLAGNVVIFTSALSCITMFFWLFVYKNLGLF